MERSHPITVCATQTALSLWPYNQHVTRREEILYISDNAKRNGVFGSHTGSLTDSTSFNINGQVTVTVRCKEDTSSATCSDLMEVDSRRLVSIYVVMQEIWKIFIYFSSLAEQQTVNQTCVMIKICP